MIDDTQLQYIKKLISVQTGLHIPVRDSVKLRTTILTRMNALKLPNPEDYGRFLEEDTDESNLEWKVLASLLTIGESHFFRDKGQFALLKNWILPKLIDRRKKEGMLRIWSAGCSTGEEPYSLAILLDELIPNRDDWNIFILGTDINEEAIGRAKTGIFSDWSFRQVDPDTKKRYFRKRGREWEFEKGIRSIVTFRHGNLMKDPCPDPASGIYDLDLIVCRNVFIYFNHEVVSEVAEKFSDSLNEGGYLLTGHPELQGHRLGHLRPKMFPESMIYQCNKREPAESERQDLKILFSTLSDAFPTPMTIHKIQSKISGPELLKTEIKNQEIKQVAVEQLIDEAEVFYRNGVYAQAVEIAERALAVEPQNFRALHLLAQACANIGQSDKATAYCHQALEADPFAIQPYYLLAHIAEERGNDEEAKNQLKKVLYLMPTFIPASLELGALYEKENNRARARKARLNALDLLKKLSPETVVEPYREMTAEELVLYVQNMIGETSKMDGKTLKE